MKGNACGTCRTDHFFIDINPDDTTAALSSFFDAAHRSPATRFAVAHKGRNTFVNKGKWRG